MCKLCGSYTPGTDNKRVDKAFLFFAIVFAALEIVETSKYCQVPGHTAVI